MAESYGYYYIVMERHWDTCFDDCVSSTKQGQPVFVIDSERDVAEQYARERTLEVLRTSEIYLLRYLTPNHFEWSADPELSQTIAKLRTIYKLRRWKPGYFVEKWLDEDCPLPTKAPADFYEALADLVKDAFYFIETLPIPPPRG